MREMELRAFRMQSKHSTTDLHPHKLSILYHLCTKSELIECPSDHIRAINYFFRIVPLSYIFVIKILTYGCVSFQLVYIMNYI